MDWSLIAPDFVPDGSLRDIYILDASIDDWVRIWEVLSRVPDRLGFYIDGMPMKPPANVEEAFRLRSAHGVTATYAWGKQLLHCHFFTEAEIEFDLDPRDVDGPVEGERLAQFLGLLGRTTSKEVRLTAENEPDAVIAWYQPATDAVIWQPVAP